MLFHVVAMAKNRAIGKDNKLPWHFASDLKHFKKLTTGETVLMGRKTFESIGRALPRRQNFVLSRGKHKDGENLKFFDSVEKALANVETTHCYIIGGANLFRQTIEGVNGIYLTLIDQEYEGDSFYPEIPNFFKPTARHKLQENPFIETIYLANSKGDSPQGDTPHSRE